VVGALSSHWRRGFLPMSAVGGVDARLVTRGHLRILFICHVFFIPRSSQSCDAGFVRLKKKQRCLVQN
jgi:hypothetical protein